jgi:phage terminase large subunit-like protein
MSEKKAKTKRRLSVAPQKGAQERALQTKALITVYGGAAGSGKSYMMLLRPLLKCVDRVIGQDDEGNNIIQEGDSDYNAIFFRRTGPQLKGAGGLWDVAKKMYAPWKPKIREGDREIIFNSGAKITFSHMEHVKNRLDHQGLQYSEVYFDEGTHFEDDQVTYLMGRLRSDAECDSTMFISCNPDPDSFLADWIDWWLDDEGFPDKEKSGKVRYYVNDDNNLEFADTEQELLDNFSHILWVHNPLYEEMINFPDGTQVHPDEPTVILNKGDDGFQQETVYAPPKTMTFIGGTIFDNPALMKANPMYLSELNSLPDIEKRRLLHGNWYARPEGSSHFERTWLQTGTNLPSSIVWCRAWDKASSQPSELEMRPDYTASAKLGKCKDGFFHMVGHYAPENFDRFEKSSKLMAGKFRERSGPRDTIIKKQAEFDSKTCTVVFSQDPGSAGATEFQESSKKLITQGVRVKKDPMPTQTGKLIRYLPFSSACEHGLVYIYPDTFPKDTLEAILKENEAFNGERSSRSRKDDWPDAYASAFNFLCEAAVIPAFTLEDFTREDPFNF